MLRWNAPEGCIQAAELAERVEKRVGKALFAATGRRMLDGHARGGATQVFGARITLLDSTSRVLGTRDLEVSGASCRVLDERLELIASMLISAQEAIPSSPPPVELSLSPPPMPPVELPPVVKNKTPAASRPLRLAVTPEHWFSNERVIPLDSFYSILGRADLRQERNRRVGLRTFGFVVASLAVAAGVGLLSAHALGAGCVRYSGSPSLPGGCVEQAPDFLIAGVSSLAGSFLGYLWAGLFRTAPTSHEEDVRMADAFNAARAAAGR